MSNFKDWLKSKRIGVLLGGISAERPISLKTGTAILKSLQRQGFKAFAIDPAKNLTRQLQKNRIDLAYIALHGPGGEDGAIQGLLEWLKIPYTGCGILASALAMDKIASKRLFDSAGIPSASWAEVHRRDKAAHRRSPLPLPCVVKPATQGSAVGVSIVRQPSQWAKALKTAFRYDAVALVESFLDGTEITVGVLGDQALPIIEIVPNDRAFYDFHAKYAPGGSRHILPARISSLHAVQASRLAVSACQIVGVKAVARVDFIIDKRRGPMILEINTIPGMTETSLLPEAARAFGLDFDALVLRIAELSFRS